MGEIQQTFLCGNILKNMQIAQVWWGTMPKIKTGYSKNIAIHGQCAIIPTTGKYLVQLIMEIDRLDGSKYLAYGDVKLVNKDEVSDIKEEEI